MARLSRLSVYQTIREVPLVPVFYHPDPEVCAGVLTACYRGGIRAFEFTNRGDFAHERFAELSRLCAREFPDMALGAGTLVDAPTAALYLQLGADFVVGPNFIEDIARVCNRRKVAYMPGCATLTEITTAHEWGVEFVKIFPGDVLGPGFVKSLRGPLTYTNAMVTGGVEPNRESLTKWFSAGVVAVGIGSQLFPKERLDTRAFDQIEATVSDLVRIIAEIK
ncbi:bifunctional 4-hydroxy-2-oxoglutarate aldolase/2-dehydro-3-deoxy-phosphogluconate aldolase [Spirosoma sordidisoli]|uniref:Bifunctional 4-hydroxy-2-oxoglutarate aldolase/2-dehydro-3-deoxy-phosphogluconate aldolase n=1 Tax=Spirosoma sordidisoli TaxID=2502893 RepID=A0A4Q2UK49_9BACT|nr:bifunctional 4-hydroxy-2-oxoglutarate aldolase/2-dehydro-3-deoxy-phosphogluconate aldolase [Spirosoma sordidisoli]RYC67840.1 bifunctional 4-hydroxy-2-oxoglutarate aldolase/2-dehydro-3-deoxy-phosphogluconate aldolase [Spirosoma sordidisoli]